MTAAARAVLEALQAALGPEVVDEMDGAELGVPGAAFCVTPRSGDELAAALALLDRHQTPVAIRGGGTHLDYGNAFSGVVGVLSMRGRSGVVELDVEEGVVKVAAGTPIEVLRASVQPSGWDVAMDPPGEGATVGGALATGLGGPRQQGFGPLRDGVLGVEVVLASGVRTKCGGRVVKNVTGYDLAKLYGGSLGTLGVIDEVWLRLRAVPERVEARWLPRIVREQVVTLGSEIARRATARVVALLDARATRWLADAHSEATPADAASWHALVEFAGDAPAVERDVAWLAERIDGAQRLVDAEAAVAALRAVQGGRSNAAAARARIRCLRSGLDAALGASEAEDREVVAGAARLLYPGLGTLRLLAPSDAGEAELEALETAVDAAWQRADVETRKVLSASGGAGREFGASAEAVWEQLPLSRRSSRDVFGGAGPSAALMRALKTRFDANGILNPGRFGGLP